jgi:membrane associated rhomboid family serine protease
VTGAFVHVQLLQLLFSLMSYLPTAMMQERLDGTVKQAHRFFLNNTLISVLFVVVCYLLSWMYGPQILSLPSIGLWPIIMCDIVIECNKSPDLARG